MERPQVEEMRGMVKEMMVPRMNKESNTDNIISNSQREAWEQERFILEIVSLSSCPHF